MLAVNFSEFIDPNPHPGNQFGHTVVPLSTGNVVITSPYDDAGGYDAGAVYLFNGQTGALISTLTGSSDRDHVGIARIVGNVEFSYVMELTNGNFVVASSQWDNNGVVNTGAVTWGSGISGISGVVSAQNSLVGSTSYDLIGEQGITVLTNGNYVVASSSWDHNGVFDAGAATWGSGTTGVSGEINANNSLVGSSANDMVGDYRSIVALTNGHYVARNHDWDNGGVSDVGAATWGDGTTGISGTISSNNSLVGSTEGDRVGYYGVTPLTNGNYVVNSGLWTNNGVARAGAFTWGDGTTGITGFVSSSNSLVGSSENDRVGSGATVLSNGNYLAQSRYWNNNGAEGAGAITWRNGTIGTSGIVSSSNSLVGSSEGDQVGSPGVRVLSNGNYVVDSSRWNNGEIIEAGAVTWGSGISGISGVVSSSNSLVGSTAFDRVGTVRTVALSNGNYVVGSHKWDNGTVNDVGAVTWGSGTTGISGVVSASNSLVGSKASDEVGRGGLTALTNGNYVVESPTWNNENNNVGAVTWGNGDTGISGVVSINNSLIGSTENDWASRYQVTPLSNGNYVVASYFWDNGSVENAGAVTWGSGVTGIIGEIDVNNSLVGLKDNDQVGSRFSTALSNGNYVVGSHQWNATGIDDAGAVTLGNGFTEITGEVDGNNSLIGESGNSGLTDIIADNVNGTYFARFLTEGGGRVRVGDQFAGTEIDFGDAPDRFPTLYVDNGAMHYADGPRLGSTRDSETNGAPTSNALGDGADEDGISLPNFLIGTVATIDVDVQNAQATVYLDAWIDFNQDGDWDDTGEQIYASEPVASGVNQVTFSVPDDAVLGKTYARFRLSSNGGLSPSGLANDGEVEDYLVSIEAMAWFDMTVVTTPTTVNADGSVAAVPNSMTVVHEWQDYFIEVYAQVSSETSQVITDVEFRLDFDTSLINLDLANIQKGAGITNLAHGLFTGQLILSGTLDGSHPDLGIGSPFLVARIPANSAVVSNVSGEYPNESNSSLPVMNGSEISLQGVSTAIVGADAATPSTNIKAVRYDINDDNRVGLADLSMLVNAFGQSTTNSDLAYRSDFDKNGSVGLSDLSRLVNHFGYTKGDNNTITLPTIVEGEAISFMLEGQPVVEENIASIFVGQAVPDMMAEPVFTSRQAQPDLQSKSFTTTPLLEAEPIRSMEKAIENLEPLATLYELDALWSAEYDALTEDDRLLELAAVGDISSGSLSSKQDQADLADDLFAKWGLS